MSVPVLVGISVGVGLLAICVAVRMWLVRTGRFHRINQNMIVPALAVGVGIMATGSVIGLIWGRDKGAASFNGTMAIILAALTYELYRRRPQREQAGEHDDE